MRNRSLPVWVSAVFLWVFSCSSSGQGIEDLRTDPAATEHYISDDGYAEVPLDFEYPFYGQTFTNSWMFSNGVIGFIRPDFGNTFCCDGYDVTDPMMANYGTPFTLMPLQTDLTNYNGQFLTKGDEESMTYGWYDISEFGRPGSSNTFEAEIFADGRYEFRYNDLDVTRGVTIASVGDPLLGQYNVYNHGPLPPNGVETITNYGLNGLCELDPLTDPNCPGYAEAYAQQQYEQNCFMNPLYDAGCPGYAEALFMSQCMENPLYDESCPGYASAYYDLQCEQNALYDAGCPGYAQAFFLEQCSNDPLYDSSCDGYADAFLEQQCDRDPTYSASCEGYADAMEQQNKQSSPATTASTSVESITEPAVTGDATVDEVLRESRQEVEVAVIPVAPPPPEPVEESEEQESNENTESEEPEDSRRERMREIAVDRARNLANDMSRAASIEQQQAMQAQVMSLIAYVPGFSAYTQRGIPQPTDYYSPRSIYEDLEVPDSNFGARNGLAQEILHRRMVDMQYNRED